MLEYRNAYSDEMYAIQRLRKKLQGYMDFFQII